MNNKIYSGNDDIADQFNKHFVNVGPSLASKIEDSFENPTQYILSSPVKEYCNTQFTSDQMLDNNLNIRWESLVFCRLVNSLLKVLVKNCYKMLSSILLCWTLMNCEATNGHIFCDPL